MIRVVHKSSQLKLSSDYNGYTTMSKIIQLANKHKGARMVFDMRKTLKADGNLNCVYAALNFNLNRANNVLRILPRKGCGVNVEIEKDLFGYFTSWEHHLDETFRTGGTKVFVFDKHDIEGFKDYLLHSAFRNDWKRLLPYHYKLDIKTFLKELFVNASEHSNCDSPIFISSAFDGEILRFTFIDCGDGFKKTFSDEGDEVLNEGIAMVRAMKGYSSKGEIGNATLKRLGDYCVENSGELMMISGGVSVSYKEDGFHRVKPLPGAFKGSVINFSVAIKVPEFLRQAA
jgi:hypothetical protein